MPGTPIERPLFFASIKLNGVPSSRRNISTVAPAGAVSRPSYTVIAFVSASKYNIKPPPPNPELCGSTKLSIASMATAASTAEPPASNTATPAFVAWGLAVTTMPSRANSLFVDVGTDAAPPVVRTPAVSTPLPLLHENKRGKGKKRTTKTSMRIEDT